MKATALVASLVLSALLLAAATGRPSPFASVAWISPLPLFWAIRQCRPIVAASCGAIWGFSFNLLSAGAAPAVLPTCLFLLLLCAVPAIYTGLGSLMTRAIAFNPLMLACGWILLELAPVDENRLHSAKQTRMKRYAVTIVIELSKRTNTQCVRALAAQAAPSPKHSV